jgi:hypothetical protein
VTESALSGLDWCMDMGVLCIKACYAVPVGLRKMSHEPAEAEMKNKLFYTFCNLINGITLRSLFANSYSGACCILLRMFNS